jgi:hypothetical protein
VKWLFVNHLAFSGGRGNEALRDPGAGSLIVLTQEGQWIIAYSAAAQVRRINKRYSANLAAPSWRHTGQRFATVQAAERWLESHRAAIA